MYQKVTMRGMLAGVSWLIMCSEGMLAGGAAKSKGFHTAEE